MLEGRLAVAAIAPSEAAAERIVAALREAGLELAAFAIDPETLAADGAAAVDAVVIAASRADHTVARSIGLVRELLGDARVVVVADSLTQRSLRRSLDAGADAVIGADGLESTLEPAVRAACAGLLAVPREIAAGVAKPSLSAREKQILAMVVLGFTNGEIARKLYLAESTVKSHLSSAFGKLGVRSRNEATALILDPEAGLGTGILAISEPDAANGGGPSGS